MTYLKKLKCDSPGDDKPLTVETGAGPDIDGTPTTTIVVLDTDGEWIEMKKTDATKKYQMTQRRRTRIQSSFRARQY